MTEPIFHLAQPSDWARSIDVYSPASVDEEGFVHCSTGQQLAEVARTFYSGRNDLILLTIDPGMLDEGTWSTRTSTTRARTSPMCTDRCRAEPSPAPGHT